jgi:hypothetical protein
MHLSLGLQQFGGLILRTTVLGHQQADVADQMISLVVLNISVVVD